jgi:hypothetical protein
MKSSVSSASRGGCLIPKPLAAQVGRLTFALWSGNRYDKAQVPLNSAMTGRQATATPLAFFSQGELARTAHLGRKLR